MLLIKNENGDVCEAYGFIYITTNLINGRRYLGSKVFSYPSGKNNKWKDYLGSGKALKNAIKQYGRENFHRNIIYIANSFEELEQMETYFILVYDAARSLDWYNIKEGSNLVGSPYAGMNDEELKNVKIKLSAANKKKWESKNTNEKEQWKEQISLGHKSRTEEAKEVTASKIREKWFNKTEEQREIIKQKLRDSKSIVLARDGYRENISNKVTNIWANRSDEHKSEIGKKIGKKVSESWKNKSEEDKNIFKQKISKAVSGEKNGFFGKTHTDEVKERQRLRMSNENSRFAKKLFIYTESGEFVKEFPLKKFAANYLVEQGYIKTCNGAKSAIARMMRTGTPFNGLIFSHEEIIEVGGTK